MFGPHNNNKRCRHPSLSLVNISALDIGGEPTTMQPAISGSTHDSMKGSVKSRIVVQHNYHDHADVTSNSDSGIVMVTKGGVATLFPIKLHKMLSETETEGFSSIVGWQHHGRAFVVRKPKEFAQRVLPKYFGKMKPSSFQRQLNLYGFLRLTHGQDKGGYYHELFLRGREFLCQRIQRIRVKGTGARAASNPQAEPCFYEMEPVQDLPAREALPPQANAPFLMVDLTKAPSSSEIDPASGFDTDAITDEALDLDGFLKDIAFDGNDNSQSNQDSSSTLCSVGDDRALLAKPTSTSELSMQPPPKVSDASFHDLQKEQQHETSYAFIRPKPTFDVDEMCFLKSLFDTKDFDTECNFGGNAINTTSAFHASRNANQQRQRKARTVVGRAA